MPKKAKRAGLAALRKQGAGIAREAPVSYKGNGGLSLRKLRFIDLFCGIGGFRIAFERAGGECVFSCDWDRFSQITYEANFGEKPMGISTKSRQPQLKSMTSSVPVFHASRSASQVSQRNSAGQIHIPD